jgi:uncharacterized membrane protein YhaH (DUF805 family)
MDFQSAVKKGMENIGNLNGRAGRAEFWWFALAVWVAEFIIIMLVSFIFRGGFGSFLEFVIWVVAFVAIFSAAVRRLHDVNQPTWMAILWVIPCVFLIPLFFSVQPSTPGDNPYGPQPS